MFIYFILKLILLIICLNNDIYFKFDPYINVIFISSFKLILWDSYSYTIYLHYIMGAQGLGRDIIFMDDLMWLD